VTPFGFGVIAQMARRYLGASRGQGKVKAARDGDSLFLIYAFFFLDLCLFSLSSPSCMYFLLSSYLLFLFFFFIFLFLSSHPPALALRRPTAVFSASACHALTFLGRNRIVGHFRFRHLHYYTFNMPFTIYPHTGPLAACTRQIVLDQGSFLAS
jgi:hypothetical protein